MVLTSIENVTSRLSLDDKENVGKTVKKSNTDVKRKTEVEKRTRSDGAGLRDRRQHKSFGAAVELIGAI